MAHTRLTPSVDDTTSPTQSPDLGRHESSSGHVGEGSSHTIRRLRGPTMALDIWNMPEGEQIEVGFNEYDQPNDGKTKDLVRFLGSLARIPNQLPIAIDDWREIPTETKKDIWKLIKKKFKVKDDMKDYTMKSLGKKWRDWKSNLKKKYYDPDPDSVDALPIEQLENRVDAHQWRNLVQFWRSEKGTTINHTAGAKSFAQVHEELKIEREADVSRTDVFYATHRKKDGTLVDPRSGSLMEEMQNCMSQEEDTQNEGSE